MRQERRTSKRNKFIGKPIGLFFLTVSGEQHDVLHLIDVSVSGIGLVTGTYMDPGRIVRVTYKDGDTTMYTTGTITRCEETTQQRYRIGIVFDFPHREESNQFYMKVRSFLDSGQGGD